MIECKATGVVYRNPQPYLRAVHAWHPSIVAMDSDEMLCAFDLGQAAESLDYRTYVSRSLDSGQTWSPPVRLFDDPVKRRSTHTVRISRLRDGSLAGFGARFYRDDPEQGLTNRANLGFVPMDLILLRSFDRGRSWQGPTTITPSLEGPAFEICHAIVELADGRWLAPTQTWPDWSGSAPNGMRAVALVSRDGGRTWPEHLDEIGGSDRRVGHFEQSLTQLPDGRLVAVAWAYDSVSNRTLPTPYAISDDGRTFGPARATGIFAQTMKILALPDGRILSVYRRDDKPGLWATVARLRGDVWINLAEQLLWDGAASGMTGNNNMGDQLSALKFGFPSLVQLPGGEVLVAFWCEEDGVNVIRWFRLAVAASLPAPHIRRPAVEIAPVRPTR